MLNSCKIRVVDTPSSAVVDISMSVEGRECRFKAQTPKAEQWMGNSQVVKEALREPEARDASKSILLFAVSRDHAVGTRMATIGAHISAQFGCTVAWVCLHSSYDH